MARLGLLWTLSGWTLAVAGLVAASCGGNPTAPSTTSDPTTNLRLMLTDDLADDVDAVFIYFTGVTAKPAGGPVEDLTLELDPNPVDLLTLTEDVTALAAGAVPSGDYEFIHVNIDEGRSSVIEAGVERSLQVPSEEVKILGGFTVEEDRITTLTLDFDAGASLLKRGNGEWLLRPLILVTGADGRMVGRTSHPSLPNPVGR